MSRRPLTNLAWVRPAAAVAAIGFSIVGLLVVLLQPADRFRASQNLITAVLCWVVFFLAVRRPRGAALFGVAVIGLELAVVMFRGGTIHTTSILVFPFLVVSVALLYGPRGMAVALGTASLVIIAAPMLGRMLQGLPGFTLGQVLDLVVVQVELFAVVYFGHAVAGAYQKLLTESERSRQRYRDLFEHAPDGLVELDQSGRIVEANPLAREFLGVAPADPKGRMIDDVLAAAGGPAGMSLAHIDEDLPTSFELGSGPGARFVEITARIQPGATARTLLVIRDSTTRRSLEAGQEQAQRLETVGRLAGGIAHDFNNLLTAIGGNAGILVGHSNREVAQMAGDILKAQQRAAHLIRQLLSFSQHDFQRPELINLLRDANDWRDLLRRQVEPHCRLEIDGDDAAAVVADVVQVQRILLNLISNARDASPAGAVIRVRFRRLERIEAEKLGSSLPAETQAAIEVADVGAGMTPEVMKRLFEPFFTTKPQGKGTGLGLAAVHGLVAQNAGAIQIRSILNQGTTVTVFLPAAAAGR